MENIVVLAFDEVVRLDGRAITGLRDQLGEAGAEGVLSRAMEEMANRLSLIERSYYQNDQDAVWKAAKGLTAISEQVGLVSLSEACRAVAGCCQTGDPVALSATVGRLMRLGDRSLTAVWDMPEVSTF